MTDLLLLGGAALCALSLVVAVVQLLRTEPPRAAAILLLLGIVAMFAGAYLKEGPFQAQDIPDAWGRTFVPAPAPAATQ
ncbi:hypothetical protein FNJ84_02335 [Paracoccus sp. M683]|uniref:hypothetical protein n=1 Tax=Paracoccus sp. M683 TaxID=2594268 RepID=UPI00117C2DC4|nr:hypothetical protein [Paracoccus sp. M683]TRW99532.1 hypothetical protein FNJ84_02335 [Paracoccus sp. M683]